MQTFRSFTMSVALLASLIAQSTFAQGTITTFEAMPQTLLSDSRYVLGGTFGEQRLAPLSGTMSGQLDLNDEDLTATFRRVTVNVDETISLSRDFVEVISGGFGATTTITNTISGTITFDSTINFFDDQPITTTALPNNQFLIPESDFQNLNLPRTDQNQIHGRYEFSGPTESVEGTFQVSPANTSWERHVPFGEAFLDTTDYPNEVTIISSVSSGVAFRADDEILNLINENIDGMNISVDLTWAEFYSNENFEFQNAGIVPEPSEYALMIGLGLLGFVAIRRMSYKT